MKILLLGYGQEGKSAETYFKPKDATIEILDNFSRSELAQKNFDGYDLILRSPSVFPLKRNWSSMTKYFFAHCPCPIIGVTGTKGKGTTCSIIKDLLEKLGKKVWLVGNIGKPAFDVLDSIKQDDVVVYELSSYQLWDLEASPHIAVVLRIEPDHLNVHSDFADYVNAKSNIARHQNPNDYCIYYQNNPESHKIAELSPGEKLAYPISGSREILDQVLDRLNAPGNHNRENAEAALLAISAYYQEPLKDFLINHRSEIEIALEEFHGLPHRLEFLREAAHVAYYDDNFSAAYPALDVALAAFPNQDVVLIAGGKDRGLDLHPMKTRIFNAPNLKKVFLIGEISSAISAHEDPEKYQICSSLDEAFECANKLARQVAEENLHASDNSKLPVVLLMSPGAPSFDMFKNFQERGKKFQELVSEIK